MKHKEILDAISNNNQMRNAAQRHEELLRTTVKNSPAHAADVDPPGELVESVDSFVRAQFYSRFRQIMHAGLQFPEMPDRLERIPKAHQETFDWVFKSPVVHSDSSSWDDFAEWLSSTEQSRIYWITGKVLTVGILIHI